jgi:hypothetical protein
MSQGKCVATVYSNNELGKPSIDLPGLVWKVADKNTLFDEVLSRLMTRAEVNRWYDSSNLGMAVFLFAFVYAFTRYSVYVNGSYPIQMIPLYVLNKAIAWTSLWIITVAPFAGNLLALSAAALSWSQIDALDKVASTVGAILMILPVVLFALPFGTWAVLRAMCASWNTNPHQDIALTKSMLIDVVSMKNETGLVGFAYLVTHAFMSCLIAVPQYKTKWFNADNNGRYYGNNELSLTFGVIAFTLVVILAIRSLLGKDSWMKLKPFYSDVSSLAIFLATFHVIMMGYNGWEKLFAVDSHNGQPSITFVSSMFSLGVVGAHFLLAAVGTKKRMRKLTCIVRHTAIEDAFNKYAAVCCSKENNAIAKVSSNDTSETSEGRVFGA